MARSQLTLRTLGLATIALFLACAHAVQARKGPASATGSRAFARSPSAPAAPRHSGSPGVATVRGGKGGGNASSVATFTGEAGARRTATGARAEMRISTPARPYAPRAAADAGAKRSPARRIRVAAGAAPARPHPAPTPARPAPARTAAAPAPAPARIDDPVLAAALRPPVQRPAPERNAFALGLAAMALATPATAAEAPGVRPRAGGRTSGTRR